jgi:acyl-CoA hydrolase
MDRAASIAAEDIPSVVTASVNHVAFNRAIPLGSVVGWSQSFRSFKVRWKSILIFGRRRESGNKTKTNIYTFVAVDDTEDLLKYRK